MPNLCDPAAVPLDRRRDGAAIRVSVDSVPSHEIPHVPAHIVRRIIVVDERGEVKQHLDLMHRVRKVVAGLRVQVETTYRVAYAPNTVHTKGVDVLLVVLSRVRNHDVLTFPLQVGGLSSLCSPISRPARR